MIRFVFDSDLGLRRHSACTVKRGDVIPVELLVPVTVSSVILGVKALGDAVGGFLALCNTFVFDSDDDAWHGNLALNSQGLGALFTDGVDRVEVECEVQFTGSDFVISTRRFKLIVEDDLIKGSEGVVSDPVPDYITRPEAVGIIADEVTSAFTEAKTEIAGMVSTANSNAITASNKAKAAESSAVRAESAATVAQSIQDALPESIVNVVTDNPSLFRGPKGDTGPQGLQGPKGDAGPKGDTGSQGPQGLKGDTGPQGPQGAKGDAGPQGVQGLKGDTGALGPKGDTGPQGLQGPKGDTGPKGDPGAGDVTKAGYNIFSGTNIFNGVTSINSSSLRISGGSVGQILSKTSTGAVWIDPPSGGGGDVYLSNANSFSKLNTFKAGIKTNSIISDLYFELTSVYNNSIINVEETTPNAQIITIGYHNVPSESKSCTIYLRGRVCIGSAGFDESYLILRDLSHLRTINSSTNVSGSYVNHANKLLGFDSTGKNVIPVEVFSVPLADENTSGTTKLYNNLGTGTDGTMHQSAISTALDGKMDANAGNAPAEAKAIMANMAMPSGTRQNLTLPSDGGSIVAPSDGYIVWGRRASTNQVISIIANGLVAKATAFWDGELIETFIPIKKGATAIIWYNANGNGAGNYFSLIKCVGAN